MTGNALLLVWLQKSRWLQQQQASVQQHQLLLPVVGRQTEGKEVGELPLAVLEQQRRDVLGLQLQEQEQLGDELLQYLRQQQQQASVQQQQLPVVGWQAEGNKVGELPLAAMEQQRRDLLGLQLQEQQQLAVEQVLGQSRRVLCSLPSNAAAALHTHVLSCRA